FSDPEIIRIKWSPLRKAVAYAIATLRRKTSEGYYRQIGGGSPLRRLTEEQAAALQEELGKRGTKAQTYVGMCTWRPFLSEAVEKIVQSHLEGVVILPLFPEFSVTTTGSGFAALRQLLESRPEFKQIDVRWIRAWHDNPAYIESFAAAIRRELPKFAAP